MKKMHGKTRSDKSLINKYSDSNTAIQNLRDVCLKFRAERKWTNQNAATFAKDIAVEAGELLEHFVWEEDAYLHNAEIAHEVKYEVVDVFFGILIMSDILKIDLSQTLLQKLKIMNQKYPIKKCVNIKKAENQQVEWRKWAHQRKKIYKKQKN